MSRNICDILLLEKRARGLGGVIFLGKWTVDREGEGVHRPIFVQSHA